MECKISSEFRTWVSTPDTICCKKLPYGIEYSSRDFWYRIHLRVLQKDLWNSSLHEQVTLISTRCRMMSVALLSVAPWHRVMKLLILHQRTRGRWDVPPLPVGDKHLLERATHGAYTDAREAIQEEAGTLNVTSLSCPKEKHRMCDDYEIQWLNQFYWIVLIE